MLFGKIKQHLAFWNLVPLAIFNTAGVKATATFNVLVLKKTSAQADHLCARYSYKNAGNLKNYLCLELFILFIYLFIY